MINVQYFITPSSNVVVLTLYMYSLSEQVIVLYTKVSFEGELWWETITLTHNKTQQWTMNWGCIQVVTSEAQYTHNTRDDKHIN